MEGGGLRGHRQCPALGAGGQAVVLEAGQPLAQAGTGAAVGDPP